MIQRFPFPGRVSQLDPANPLGVDCDAAGPRWGPLRLLRRSSFGFEPRPKEELKLLLGEMFSAPVEIRDLMQGLDAIADSLNRGDLPLAKIVTLQLSLPAVEERHLFRWLQTEKLLKFNPDEPRDWHGRWIYDGGGSVIPAQEVFPGADFLFGRIPGWLRPKIDPESEVSPKDLEQPRVPIPNQSGKEAADDIPEWAEGEKPMIREDGKEFAKRLMDRKYKDDPRYPDGWQTDRSRQNEYNKLQKWGSRHFKIRDWFWQRYGA